MAQFTVNPTRFDPYKNFKFRVKWDGKFVAGVSKVGGLSKAKVIRDVCGALGIAMTIEDTWGSDVTTAAIAHLAHSTPPELLLSTTDFNSYVTVSTAEGAPCRTNGRMKASAAPGLGVTPRMEALGAPVLEVT